MSDNVYTPRRNNWNVKWNGSSLGTVYQIDPSGLKWVLDAITRGTTGKVVLGHWFIGMEGTIKIQCADVTLLIEESLGFPWGQQSGAYSMSPMTPNTNLYQYAQLLNLHPTDVAVGTLTEDINLIKTVPISPPTKIKRDGVKDDVYEVEFQVYPDVNRLMTEQQLVYGYLGSTAP